MLLVFSQDIVNDFPSPECDVDNTMGKAKQTEKHPVAKKQPEIVKRLKTKENMKKSKVNYAKVEKEVKLGNCCHKKCIRRKLSISDVYETRQMFFDKSQEQQRAYLINFFQISQRSKNGRTVYAHYVNGKEVCQKAWIFSHGMAYGRYAIFFSLEYKRNIRRRQASRLTCANDN